MMWGEELVPVRETDLELGRPLRFPVYDARGVLLMARGALLDSEQKIDFLVKKGLFRSSLLPASKSDRQGEAPGKSDQSRPGLDKAKTVHPFARLPIGLTVSLQANSEDFNDRYVCRYIGYFEEKTFLVSNPISEGRLVPCRDGQGFNVSCFNGRTALAFKSYVLEAHLVPFSYLHLAFPRDIEVKKVRESYRADVDLIAAAEVSEVNTAVRIANLGLGGAQIIAGRPLGNRGDAGRLSFRIGFEDREAYIKADIVLRSRTLGTYGGKPVFAYGVQFGGLTRAHRAMIMNQVYRAGVEP